MVFPPLTTCAGLTYQAAFPTKLAYKVDHVYGHILPKQAGCKEKDITTPMICEVYHDWYNICMVGYAICYVITPSVY